MFLLKATKLTLMNSMTQCWLLVTESIAKLDYNKQNKVPVAYENRIENKYSFSDRIQNSNWASTVGSALLYDFKDRDVIISGL